jgi:hypothetical protein
MSKTVDIDVARHLRFPIWLRVKIGAKQWSWRCRSAIEQALDLELKGLKADALKAIDREWGSDNG